MQSGHDLVGSQPPQALGVSSPGDGRVGGHAPIVVQIYGLGRGVTLETQRGNLAGREGAFELEAHGKILKFDPLSAIEAHGFVTPVEGDVTAVFLSLKAVDQEHVAEFGCGGGHKVSPFKTAILILPAGYGKSTIACELSHRLGCEGVVHEWCTNESLTPGWLHLTNESGAIAPSAGKE